MIIAVNKLNKWIETFAGGDKSDLSYHDDNYTVLKIKGKNLPFQYNKYVNKKIVIAPDFEAFSEDKKQADILIEEEKEKLSVENLISKGVLNPDGTLV